jgi:hypothetical protein
MDVNTIEGTVGWLTPLPVTVEGQWLPPPKRDWQGQITAAEPVVAVLFLCVGATCRWSKSERRGDVRVRLALFPYDDAGDDVQLNCSVGGGYQICRLSVRSTSYLPDLPSRREFRCGSVQKVAQVEGNPAADLLILFIARSDVRSARCGLWHLRKEFLESISDESLRGILTYGRCGRLNRGGHEFLSL